MRLRESVAVIHLETKPPRKEDVHILRDYVALIEVLVTHIEHLGERQELGILMLSCNLAHLVKIPFILDITSDMESEGSRKSVVEIPVNLLKVSLRILVENGRIDSSRLDDLLVNHVVAKVIAALGTDCTVTAIHDRDKRHGWDCSQFCVAITDLDMQVADVL